MTKPIPTVQTYMTTSPHSIGSDQSLQKAAMLMGEHAIRHLPVLRGGTIVGLLSERDVNLIRSLKSVNVTEMKVEDAMSDIVYTVDPSAPLDQVVEAMAERKYGCAVVAQNGRVVGIFTTVDVCRALHDLLHTRLAK